MVLTSKLSKFLNLRTKIGISSTNVVLDAAVVIESGMEYEEKVSDDVLSQRSDPGSLKCQDANADFLPEV